MIHPWLLPRSRRAFFRDVGHGFFGTALTYLLAQDGFFARAADDRAAGPRSRQHHPPRAKSVIVLFMPGGVSQVDTFDPKPELTRRHGETSPQKSDPGAQAQTGKLFGSPWKFAPAGRSGIPVSALFPHVARCVDDLAIIRSMQTDTAAHAAASMQMNTGFIRNGFPSVGSWVSYGLGRANDNLPCFVVLNVGSPYGGPPNWGSGFIPAEHQGVQFGGGNSPVANLKPGKGTEAVDRRGQLDLLARLNRWHHEQQPDQAELTARMESYELAFRMQTHAPEAVNLSQETAETQALYGIDHPTTRLVGQQCLLARRLVERGVRFVQLFHSQWDAHSDIQKNHEKNGASSDRPIAGLLTDLKRRGLLESTLVVWTSEFGRTPHAQGQGTGAGRDHHARGFTTWLAGGGIQGGMVHGATDELGYTAVENPVHVHDLHATILHLLGIDHEKLTFRHAGRDYRLTDVQGQVIQGILA